MILCGILCLVIGMITLFLLYLFLIAPGKKRNNLTPFLDHLYAHRGLFNNAQGVMENSLEAFRIAAQNGYGIELDVQLTRDGVPVVFHDRALMRLYGIDKTINELDYAQVMFLPTLESALKCIDKKVPILVELKPHDRIYLLCEKALDILTAYSGPYAVISFHPFILRWFRKNAPHIPRGQLTQNGRDFLYHILSRPDFVAARIGTEKGFAFSVLTRFFKPTTIAWTVRTQAQSLIAQNDYTLQIFEQWS